MIASPLIAPLLPITVSSCLFGSSRHRSVRGETAAKIEKEDWRIPPIVPPLQLLIAALRVPVETLFAVTMITASDPIVPGSLKIKRVASPAVVRSPVRLKLRLALPTMFPPPALLLSIAASRAPPLEMLAAVTLITASDPIIPPK